MLSVAICDDDKKQCSYIEQVLTEHKVKEHELIKIHIFHTGEELCMRMQKGEHFNILFLDIELDKINGIEVGRMIRFEMENDFVQIIYISSFSKYMPSLFRIQPIEFLKKPISEKAIIDAFEDGIRRIRKQGDEVFCYKIVRDECKILVREILYFKSAGREVEMVTTNGSIFFYASLSKIEEELKAYNFCYSHRSYLVNYRHVSYFNHQRLIMINGDELPVSIRKFDNLRRLQQKEECFV